MSRVSPFVVKYPQRRANHPCYTGLDIGPVLRSKQWELNFPFNTYDNPDPGQSLDNGNFPSDLIQYPRF